MERVLGTHCAEPNPMFGIEGYAYEFVIKEEIKQEDIGKYDGCIKVGQDKVIYSRRYYDDKFGCNIMQIPTERRSHSEMSGVPIPT